ncbi:Pumilio-likey domain family member 6 [Pseudocercospora fuligena]|uniref:Pumilio-likey domain family member 6 n=1 Tax=Pseudocercospora fuligena TaxID=685502 RepID=A0A8H6VKX6_9PEZI|nr:Pumilio-likey domain family member 6 [Pseudocercospora fuligena]
MSNKMGGVKRKEAPSNAYKSEKKQKTGDFKPKYQPKPAKRSHLDEAAEQDDDEAASGEDADTGAVNPERKKNFQSNGKTDANGKFKLDTSSAEAHAKQRQLAKERKAAKPNADAVQRTKQLWERLRRKSHVPKEERKELVTELFQIIDGRVRDFVFKHDSVRVVQCAIKYARSDQLKGIVKELKGDVRDLVESRYGKFLVAKMVVQGDREDKDLIVPQFYGHIKRLINHPEASWIVDDIYRQVATPQQKAMMLREWYGAEYALEGKQKSGKTVDKSVTSNLKTILDENPEKRKPILSYLKTMINNLIQKKMTGFTMLHDAMLQYFLATMPGSEEQSEFLEILKGDIDAEEENGGGDLYRNLAFTRNGAHLVCLALAHGSAKDRKVILKCFKDHIEAMAFDRYAKIVLVTGLDVPDDTKMTSQTIVRELLGLQTEDQTQRFDRLEGLITSLDARVPILYPMAGAAKWLMSNEEKQILNEVHEIRKTTSKKDPEARRQELIKNVSEPLLEFVADRATNLVQSSFASQAVTEILLECSGSHRDSAKQAVAELAAGDPTEETHIARDAASGRMLKALVAGGPFDPKTKTAKLSDPRLGFADALYPVIKDHLVDWACSDSSFVCVALLESEDVSDDIKKDVKKVLKSGKKQIQKAAEGGDSKATVNGGDDDGKKSKKGKAAGRGNAGARILLEKL